MMAHFEDYATEVKVKWGNTDAYKEHAERTKNYSSQKWSALSNGMDQIMATFASCMQNDNTPASSEAQCLVKALQDHITGNYYRCTNEILAGLGQMYISDQRFQSNIDKHATGTAAFISEAIHIYCNK